MSDERNESTGQFTEANLTGERASEAALGWIPHEEAPVEKGTDGPNELASMLADARDADDAPDEVLGLTDPDDDGSPKQAISQQQLTDSITEHRLAHEGMVEMVGNSEVAALADILRAEMRPELGLPPEPGQKPAEPVTQAEPSPDVQVMMDAGLDRDDAEALSRPKVRAAVEQEFAQAAQVKEAYTNSLQVGQQMLQATVAALAPQLDGMPVEHWPQAIQMLAEVDPVRANLVADTLTKWGQIQQAQQQVQHQQAQLQYQQFENTVQAEDARLVELVGDKAKADAANDATISYLARHGIPRNQMLQAFKANPVLQTAEARQTIWEAEQYRKIQNTKVTASARPAPPVQRPGVAISAAERQASSVDARTSKARARIDSGKGDVGDLASILGSLRRA